MALGKTARFYRNNPESYKKKLAKANSHPVWGEQTAKRKKKRIESARERRKAKRDGKNINGKHYDHRTNSFKSQYDNTSAPEKSRKRGSKRNKRMFGKALKKAMR